MVFGFISALSQGSKGQVLLAELCITKTLSSLVLTASDFVCLGVIPSGSQRLLLSVFGAVSAGLGDGDCVVPGIELRSSVGKGMCFILVSCHSRLILSD